MDDLVGKLRCCAGISPEAPVTSLNPVARALLEASADEIERLRAELALWRDDDGLTAAYLAGAYDAKRAERNSHHPDGRVDRVKFPHIGRQERLGPEFEAAIFSDLDGLYED